ncbi:MAG: type II toxin-antitoxin system HicA family toxin [Dehalococcoidia bacterium]|nr:type II toxin-antitoxin system HicA family toxin [Dehalococcoidia bacterium]
MKLPRDVSGSRLSSLVRRYGYEITRQTGSHMRLTATARGSPHHITIPVHKDLTVGTLNAILTNIASYLEMDCQDLVNEIFGK